MLMTADTTGKDALTALAGFREAVKALAEAEKTRADADSVRADAEKARAESDKVRAETEESRAAAQVKLEESQADLEGKRIANDKARWDAEAARVDKTIERLTGSVPDLASLQKNTVTFTGDAALRQGEAVGAALRAAAAQVAEAVNAALYPSGDDQVGKRKLPVRVHVTADSNIASAVAAYRQLEAEIVVLVGGFDEANRSANEALRTGEQHTVALLAAAVPAAAITVAAVAGEVVTQLASLLEVDVTATTAQTDVPALSVQAAVLGELLRLAPGTEIIHTSMSAPGAASAMLESLRGLLERQLGAATTIAQLDQAAEALGDPDEKKDPQGAARLRAIKDAKAALSAVSTRTHEMLERITQRSPEGTSPLGSALAVEPLVAAPEATPLDIVLDSVLGSALAEEPPAEARPEAEPWVLVLGGATAETSQLIVARRILAPRLQTSASVAIDYFVLHGPLVRAAGRKNAAVAYHGQVTSMGADWTSLMTLPT